MFEAPHAELLSARVQNCGSTSFYDGCESSPAALLRYFGFTVSRHADKAGHWTDLIVRSAEPQKERQGGQEVSCVTLAQEFGNLGPYELGSMDPEAPAEQDPPFTEIPLRPQFQQTFA